MTHPSPLTNHSTRVTNLTPITNHKKGPLGWHGHSVGISPPSPSHLTTAHLSSGDHVVMLLEWVSASSLWTFSWPVSHLSNPSKIITVNPVSHRGNLPASHCAALCLQGSDHAEHAGQGHGDTVGCSALVLKDFGPDENVKWIR